MAAYAMFSKLLKNKLSGFSVGIEHQNNVEFNGFKTLLEKIGLFVFWPTEVIFVCKTYLGAPYFKATIQTFVLSFYGLQKEVSHAMGTLRVHKKVF